MNAQRDENNVHTLIAALNTDGKTVTRICAQDNALCVADGTTGSDHGRTVAVRDENFVPVVMAVSSVDGKTPVEVYADSNGNLLIQTT